MSELVYCLGKGRKKKKLHADPQHMTQIIGQDAYKCRVCGFTLTGINIVKNRGLNEYWSTGKDLGNPGTSQGAGHNAYPTPTYHYTHGASTTQGTASPLRFNQVSSAINHYYNSWANWLPMPLEYNNPIPTEKRDDPIRAWRLAANVREENGVVLFRGITGPEYTMDDRAICLLKPGRHHWVDIPVINCSCGFHAMKPGAMLLDPEYMLWHILLEVELYGRVLEAQRGYRAQHQRILQVYGNVANIPGIRVESREVGHKKILEQIRKENNEDSIC